MSFLASTLEDIWNTLKEITRPIWEPISNFFGWIYETLGAWWSDFSTWFWSIASDIGASIYQWIGWILEGIEGGISTIYNNIISVGGWIRDSLASLSSDISSFFTSLGSDVQKAADTIASEVERTVSSTMDTASTTLQGVSDDITKSIMSLPDTLGPVIQGPLSDLSNAITEIQNAFALFFNQLQQIVNQYGTLRNPIQMATELENAAQELISRMKIETPELEGFASSLFQMAEAPLKGDPKGMMNAFDKAKVFLWDFFMGMFNPKEPPSIDQAKRIGFDLIFTNFLLNAITTIIELIDSVYSLGILKDIIRQMLRDLYWTTGLAWVSWVNLSPILRHRIVEPFDRWFREHYRLEYPTRGMLDDMLEEGWMTEEEWKTWMGKLGYPDDIIEKYLETRKSKRLKDLTRTIASQFYQYDIISESQLRSYLLNMGYPEEIADLIVELEKRKKESKGKGAEREASLSLWSAWYRADLIDVDTYRRALKDLGYSDDVIELMIEYDNWRKQHAAESPEKEASRTMLEKWYKVGLIGDAEFTERMRQLGYPDEIIDLELRYLKMIMAGQGEPQLREATRGMVEQWFRVGIINEDQLRDYLRKLRYPDDVIENIIRYNKIKYLTKPEERKKPLTVTQISEAFRKGLISREEAVRRFTELGYTPDDAELLAKIYLIAQEPEHREITRSLLERAFVRGLIDETGFRERLVDLGYTVEDANLIIMLTKARMEIQPEDVGVKQLTTSQILNSLSRGIITLDEAMTQLRNLGYSDGQIEILIANEIYEWLKSYKVPQPLLEILMSRPDRIEVGLDLIEKIRNNLKPEEYTEPMVKAGYTDDLIRYVLDRILGS